MDLNILPGDALKHVVGYLLPRDVFNLSMSYPNCADRYRLVMATLYTVQQRGQRCPAVQITLRRYGKKLYRSTNSYVAC